MASAPLQDALSHRTEFGAKPAAPTVLPVLQRDDTRAAKHATIKLGWDGQLENKTQLQPVLDARKRRRYAVNTVDRGAGGARDRGRRENVLDVVRAG